MRTATTARRRTAARYPNAAEPMYFVDKLMDRILSAAAYVGTVTILFFLLTM